MEGALFAGEADEQLGEELGQAQGLGNRTRSAQWAGEETGSQETGRASEEDGGSRLSSEKREETAGPWSGDNVGDDAWREH